MFVLFILCLFVVVVVVGGNVSKCEVNFRGATKDVNLKQWRLNHLSGKSWRIYERLSPIIFFLHSLCLILCQYALTH